MLHRLAVRNSTCYRYVTNTIVTKCSHSDITVSTATTEMLTLNLYRCCRSATTNPPMDALHSRTLDPHGQDVLPRHASTSTTAPATCAVPPRHPWTQSEYFARRLCLVVPEQVGRSSYQARRDTVRTSRLPPPRPCQYQYQNPTGTMPSASRLGDSCARARRRWGLAP
jgi:hypothetical protein